METNTNTTFANFLLAATLSSSVIVVSSGPFEEMIPFDAHEIQNEPSLSDWDLNAFNVTPDYLRVSADIYDYQTILQFSQKLIENSSNVESDFVDIVNENFWDLI